MSSTIIASTIKQSLSTILQKHKISCSSLLSSRILGKSTIKGQSYQQAQFNQTKAKLQQLLDTLNKFQDKISSNILNLVAKKANCFSTSLLSHSQEIFKFITALKNDHQNNLLISLVQRHYASQSILLALYLTLIEKLKILLVVDKQSKKDWQSYLISSDEPDPLGRLQTYLQSENIQTVSLQNLKTQQIKEFDYIFIDIFNLSPISYRPILLSLLPTILNDKPVIIYSSNCQNQQLEYLFYQQICIGENFDIKFEEIIVNPDHPSQALEFQKPQQQIILSFLKEEANHPNRQDIIIFFSSPTHQSVERYLTKFQQKIMRNLRSHAQLINIIYKPNMIVEDNKNNIFLAEDSQQLKKWNYFYGKVFYVIDYGYQIRFYLDYKSMLYVQTIKAASSKQTSKRQNFISVYKVGRYASVKKPSNMQQQNESMAEVQFDYVYQQYGDQTDISNYILNMINKNQSKLLQTDNKRIKECLNALVQNNILSYEQEKITIINKDILSYNTNPLFINLILKNKDNPKLVNLLIMTISIFITRGNLRKSLRLSQSKAVNKPIGIWRQSGYLHSALDIITRTQLIQNNAQVPQSSKSSGKKSQMKKNTSLANQAQFEVYGNLFEVVQPKKLSFQQMDFQDFLRENLINQEVLHEIKDHIDHFRQMFSIDQKNIYLKQADVIQIIKQMSQSLTQGKNIGIYSGSRRVGYLMSKQNKGIFPYKSSLMSLLYENPQYLYIMRIIQSKQTRQILIANSISADNYLDCVGQLPAVDKKSYGECQIEFHGISSATMEGLHSYYGKQISKFQQQYQCMVEPNQQMALIIVYCPKNKQKIVKQKFEAILIKIKQRLVNSTKIMNYLGNTNMSLGNGGIVTQILKDNYINKCRLANLHYLCAKQDLWELFEEFFKLKSITMQKDQYNPYKLSAIIQFHSQKDYYRFRSYFHQCLFMEKYMEVYPIKNQNKDVVRKQMYIKAYWYNWKSHCKAMIAFELQQCAIKAFQELNKNTVIDGKNVGIQLKENNQILITDLKSTTDQIFLDEIFKKYGNIKNIQILKTPNKQNNKDYQNLDFHIKKSLNDDDVRFDIQPVQKQKNGLRTAKILFYDQKKMKKVCTDLNKVINFMGTSRLYMSQRYTYPILIPSRKLLSLYQQLLNQCISGLPQQNDLFKIHTFIHEDYENSKLYIIAKSRNQQIINTLNQKFTIQLQGIPADLSEFERNILLNQIGFANIIDLQQKYQCWLIPNYIKKTLNILTPFKNLKKIKESIKFRINQNFFYRIPLNSKGLKYLKQNPEKYLSMEKTYHLTLLQLQEISKCLVIQGSAVHVQNALSYLMHLIQSISVPQEQMINTDACGICCQQPNRPYRLQKCGHKFCLNCLIDALNMALGDITMFPLKCPHCLTEMVINDLQSLLEDGGWQKLLNMSVNQYVGKHPQSYTFCFTAGCKQINTVLEDHFKCDTCMSAYCLQCKLGYHPGLTCQQAKQGGDLLFKKFMQQNNIRKCPYEKCGMPIERVDGCYRVTCNRCGKSMCFKCQADKMIAYDNYNDCYKHLTDAHGGYW